MSEKTMELPDFDLPWRGIWFYNQSVANAIVEEFRTELGHPHGLQHFHLEVIARRVDCDQVLLYVDSWLDEDLSKRVKYRPGQLVIALLTWSGTEEAQLKSHLEFFDSFDRLREHRLNHDMTISTANRRIGQIDVKF